MSFWSTVADWAEASVESTVEDFADSSKNVAEALVNSEIFKRRVGKQANTQTVNSCIEVTTVINNGKVVSSTSRPCMPKKASQKVKYHGATNHTCFFTPVLYLPSCFVRWVVQAAQGRG